MPASSAAISVLKSSLPVLLVLAFLKIPAPAQTSLNDVHITPRTPIPGVAGTVNSLELVGGSYLHVIKEDVNLVLVSVSVTDPMQRLVTGLAPENFQVFEGKKSQEIRHFSSEDAPVSVGIILDSSGSMSDKMDRVREAVNQFCQAANPQDEFLLITFAEQPRLASDFTNTPEDLQNALLYTQPRGRTALLDAIYMGLGKMRGARYPKKALLIISDGGDNHSRYGEYEVRSAVKESDVMVYSIGVFDRSVPTREERLGPELLSSIAEPSGGRAFTVLSATELPTVAHRIGTELRTQYVLGYRPENAPHDGKWHKISVKLRLPRKFSFLQAHARKGYYAHQSDPVALQQRPDQGSER
jgi:Ca-activated chloride channel homolog